MMSDAVIVALITGVCAIIAQLVISHNSSKELYARLDKQSEISDAKIQGEIDVIKSEIQTLSTRVEKHNNMIERTYSLERRMDVTEERVKVANNRISDLEKEEHKA